MFVCSVTIPFGAFADERDGGWIAAPSLIYTPETSVAMTVAGLRYFRLHEDAQTASLIASGTYTLNNQARIRIVPEISLFGGKGWFEGFMSFAYWPDAFYGVGHDTPKSNEEDYTSRVYTLDGTLIWQVFSGWSLGFTSGVRYSNIVRTEDEGLLESASILGSEGAVVLGGGPVAVWDSRDNRFAPQMGSYFKVAGLAYSDQRNHTSFSKLELDARQFFPVTQNSVFALQEYATFMGGSAPFQELSRIGDIREISLMRGYYSGRYLDRNLIVVQGEWRYPIARRVSGTLFTGIGVIGDDLTKGSDRSVYESVGAGLRYQASARERINLRLDIAFGRDTSGIYLGIMEAF